jgi:hypothetical protein
MIFFAKPFGASGRNGPKEVRGAWLPIPGGPLLNAHKHFMLPHKPRIYQEYLLDGKFSVGLETQIADAVRASFQRAVPF